MLPNLPTDIKENEVYVHEETGQSVTVIAVGYMKDGVGDGSDWYAAVSYRNPTGDAPDNVFTRSAASFHDKFCPTQT